jgi:CrcB protein
MEPWIIVGIGGSIGAVLRYLVSGIIPARGAIPTGTLTVNAIGSLILSMLTFSTTPGTMVYLVNIGILGSFTTFSTFAYETFRLLDEGDKRNFSINILLNLSLCLIAVAAGYMMVRLI